MLGRRLNNESELPPWQLFSVYSINCRITVGKVGESAYVLMTRRETELGAFHFGRSRIQCVHVCVCMICSACIRVHGHMDVTQN